jgi:hypothetical protein
MTERKVQRRGKLAIPLPFDEAVKASLETKAPPKPPRKRPAKKS